ncbi:hypothetical protein [Desulfuromonas carbonis]
MENYIPLDEFDFRRLIANDPMRLWDAVTLLAHLEMATRAQEEKSNSLAVYRKVWSLYETALRDDLLQRKISAVSEPSKPCYFFDENGHEDIDFHSGYIRQATLLKHLTDNPRFRVNISKLTEYLSGVPFEAGVSHVPAPVADVSSRSLAPEEVSDEEAQEIRRKQQIRERAPKARKEEVEDKLAKGVRDKWVNRLPVLEDSIKWMEAVLLLGCRCPHDILGEITYEHGTDRNKEV